MAKHLCMRCRTDVDPSANDTVSRTEQVSIGGQFVVVTGFVHGDCLDTFTPLYEATEKPRERKRG